MPLGKNKETLSSTKETPKIHLKNHADLAKQGIIIPNGLREGFDIQTTPADIAKLKEDLNTAGANQAEILKKFLGLEKEQTTVVAKKRLEELKKQEAASEKKEVSEEKKLEKKAENALENGNAKEKEAENNPDKEVAETLKENGVPKEIADKVPGILSFLPASLKKPETVAGIAGAGALLYGLFSGSLLSWGIGGIALLGGAALIHKVGGIRKVVEAFEGMSEKMLGGIQNTLGIKVEKEKSAEEKEADAEIQKQTYYRELVNVFLGFSDSNESNIKQTFFLPAFYNMKLKDILEITPNNIPKALEKEHHKGKVLPAVEVLQENIKLLELFKYKKDVHLTMREFFIKNASNFDGTMNVAGLLNDLSTLNMNPVALEYFSGDDVLDEAGKERIFSLDIISLFKSKKLVSFENIDALSESETQVIGRIKEVLGVDISSLEIKQQRIIIILYKRLAEKQTTPKQKESMKSVLKLVDFGFRFQENLQKTDIFNVKVIDIKAQGTISDTIKQGIQHIKEGKISLIEVNFQEIIKNYPLSNSEIMKLFLITKGESDINKMDSFTKINLYLFMSSVLTSRGLHEEAGAYKANTAWKFGFGKEHLPKDVTEALSVGNKVVASYEKSLSKTKDELWGAMKGAPGLSALGIASSWFIGKFLWRRRAVRRNAVRKDGTVKPSYSLKK